MCFSIFIDGESFYDDFNEYDLVLLDIDLPGIDGIELSKKIEHKVENIIFLHLWKIVFMRYLIKCIRIFFEV